MKHATTAGNRRIAKRFAAAVDSYDQHSGIQRRAATQLVGLIATASLPPRPRILELGCGTGHLTALLANHLPGARMLVTDIAAAMVVACRRQLPSPLYAVMDAMQPACSGPFDLICANLAAQWFDNLPKTISMLCQLLAADGVIAISLPAAGTFREWQQAHQALGLRPGTPALPSPAHLRSAFPATGQLQLINTDYQEHCATGLDFLRGLRAIGADSPAAGHRPLTAAQLRQVMRHLGAQPVITYKLLHALWRNNPA